MNKLLQLFPRNTRIGGVIVSLESFAILETPCFPASFYFGPVQFQKSPHLVKGEWVTTDNATSNWHRSLAEAQKESKRLDLSH